MTDLHIVQLYPDLLGVTGDRGNVDVLATRARLAGHDATVTSIGMTETAEPDADVIVIGNGPLSALRTVRDDLFARRSWLARQRETGAVIFAVGGGAELLAERVRVLDGPDIDGLGLLPALVSRTRERRVGYIVAETADGRLVGFEDHASVWSLQQGADTGIRYGTIVAGRGSLDPGGETILVDGVYATNVQGPALPLNPQLADAILRTAVARHGGEYSTVAAHAQIDEYARQARAEIERRAANKHFTAIQL